jgi:hypothetical protein
VRSRSFLAKGARSRKDMPKRGIRPRLGPRSDVEEGRPYQSFRTHVQKFSELAQFLDTIVTSRPCRRGLMLGGVVRRSA